MKKLFLSLLILIITSCSSESDKVKKLMTDNGSQYIKNIANENNINIEKIELTKIDSLTDESSLDRLYQYYKNKTNEYNEKVKKHLNEMKSISRDLELYSFIGNKSLLDIKKSDLEKENQNIKLYNDSMNIFLDRMKNSIDIVADSIRITGYRGMFMIHYKLKDTSSKKDSMWILFDLEGNAIRPKEFFNRIENKHKKELFK